MTMVVIVFLAFFTLIGVAVGTWVDPDTPIDSLKTQALTQNDKRNYELVRPPSGFYERPIFLWTVVSCEGAFWRLHISFPFRFSRMSLNKRAELLEMVMIQDGPPLTRMIVSSVPMG